MKLRYIFNGFFATLVHYAVLNINLEFFQFNSAGMANFIAAFFGISVSFLGNRYYVFKSRDQAILKQSIKFIMLYFSISLIHGLFLLIWTDLNGLDYRVGFLCASLIQFLVSYLGNRLFVFKL